jgi:hypothetical protein
MSETPPALHGGGLRGRHQVPRSRLRQGRFGRMFRNLPPYAPPDQLLVEIGGPGGLMDGGTTTSNAPTMPSGMTFLGQFVDHDITFDPVSSLQRDNDPDALENHRTPCLDLDAVYGSGPGVDPWLYDAEREHGRLLIDTHGAGSDDEVADLPRNSQGTALIGDPRNDENLLICQVHLAFLHFANRVLEEFLDHTVRPEDSFADAKRAVRWHYQWMLVHEFLPAIVGQDMVDRLLVSDDDGVPHLHNRYYLWKHEPFMPVEFSVAAYRYGHSQLRPGYGLREGVGRALFGANPDSDLRGGRPLTADLALDWDRFFDLPAPQPPQQAQPIDATIAGPVFNLPFVTSTAALERSLPFRNLRRGVTMGLPGGRQVARHLCVDELGMSDLGLDGLAGHGGDAPLWYYILKEAEVQHDGRHLGEVGGRIVGEVLLGLIAGDPMSYLAVEPCWTPWLPAAEAGDFTMADLLTFSGLARFQHYTVQPGDTLSGIAAALLGDSSQWPRIHQLNEAEVPDPDQIFPGQVLLVPTR